MAWRFRGHHRTGSQNEKESIFLVLEIKDYSIGHWHVSKWLCCSDIRPTSCDSDVISFGAFSKGILKTEAMPRPLLGGRLHG
jgi:hypothetical protein